MAVMGSNDPEWGIHTDMLTDVRRLLRRHQRHLIDHPNPHDPWWFLVDPNAEDGAWDSQSST